MSASDVAKMYFVKALSALPTRVSHLSTLEEMEWPLHLKRVGSMIWSSVRAFATDTRIFDTLIMPFVCGEFLEETLRVHGHLIARRLTDARITKADLHSLLRENRIREVPIEQVRCWCTTFTVTEEEKKRRRLITEPWLNDILLDCMMGLEPLQLPTLEVILARAHAPAAMISDYPWFYGQMPIPDDVGLFYCFRFEGRAYALKSVPTGSRQLPGLAQCITEGVAERASLIASGSITADAYIDNTRFTGTQETVMEAAQELVTVADAGGLTLNVPPFEIVTTYTFLGIAFDHNDHTVALSSKTRERLTYLRSFIESPDFESSTIRMWIQWLGLLVYASRVMNVSLGQFYYVFKFLKRRVATCALEDRASPWKCASSTLKTWCTVLIETVPRDPLDVISEEQPIYVYSDASLSGYGALWFVGPFAFCHGEADEHTINNADVMWGHWERLEHIAILEARALHYAIREVTSRFHAQHARGKKRLIHGFVDSKTLYHALRKKRSHNFQLNHIVDTIVKVETSSPNQQWKLTFDWVRSAENLADIWSRVSVN